MRLFLLFFGLLLLSAAPLDAAIAAPAKKTDAITSADLSREAVEAKLGRKLKFTERIALSIVRKRAKKQARKAAKSGPDGRITDGLAVTSMIAGILAYALTPIGAIAVILAIGALVLGIVSLNRINQSAGYRKGKGFAIAGIALGGAWLVLVLLIILLILIAFNGI